MALVPTKDNTNREKENGGDAGQFQTWKLKRVITGNKGWISSISFDPSNEWFCVGSHDETIKIFGLVRAEQKLTLTGHIGAVRTTQVSRRHPYLFSAGDDRDVRCWDLTINKVNRMYHGHLSSIDCLDIHPTMDLIASAGRDAVVRLWDIRTKESIDVLEGHTSTVFDVKFQETSPHILSASADGMIRGWDLYTGKCVQCYTQHKKGVRCLEMWGDHNMMSGSSDVVKEWDKNVLVSDIYAPKSTVNTIKRNEDGVVFFGENDGTLSVYSEKDHRVMQTMKNIIQPGSLQSEGGIICSSFDETGMRYFTGCVDKTIKMYVPMVE
ncbi:pre-mRNA-splicing factor PRP46, putative [Entamoeba invadens IP1]|uniref:Pre-mRNA-splicing factor PRP46, putative n=1 Tax=Entamoeba invadens IP1 TaxID=370355 RepID=A0A0A1TW09_ENTIV|nr:pre-mRNA-splicing factor PRP46, putative [Entamoeba invadens IP1]ELP84709.1 pre-mRNA-splicing factor PRP46, putative [Entamoeba invadens IP1]|eukprot:XP_004184055.1 pre-mRNA-splicing factor PRP46, putative [Entamoeba invadens IP1]